LFVNFFYKLRQVGIPVTPTSFLRLQKALHLGFIHSLDDFYTSARSLLIKSERYFDLYDQAFAHYFQGMEMPEPEGMDLNEAARMLLEEWLRDPQSVARALGVNEEELQRLTPQQLIEYFLERLKEQTEAIMEGANGSARGALLRSVIPVIIREGCGWGKIAWPERSKSGYGSAVSDYSQEGPLTAAQLSEALKRLRYMVPVGPKDRVNVEKTIYETMRNAGEIEIVLDRSLKDRLKVILMIDNGGWSMDPYVDVVQALFNYAGDQFKDLKIFYFHNTIYDFVWADPPRRRKPQRIEEFSRFDSETRLIIVAMPVWPLTNSWPRMLHPYRRTQPSYLHGPIELIGEDFSPRRLVQPQVGT